jgi:hypothetical protein
MDTNKDKAEFLNNFQKNSDSEDNEDVQWSQQDNFIENQSNLIKNNQINVPEHIQNTKGTALLNQEDIIPAFKKMNIRDTSTNKSKQRSKDLALNYYFGVGERPGNQNGNNEDPYELSSSNNKQSDSTYMQFNHNNFFQQTTVSQQQQPNLGLNSNNSNNNTQQINEQDIIKEQQQQPTNFTSLLNMQNNSNNIISNIQSNNNNNNNTPQRAINTNNTNRLIEKYNVNSQPYIPKNKDLNYYKNPQLLQQPPDQHLQQLQSQIQPNADVDNQLYKLNLSKSSNIPGKFYVIKSVDEANIKRVSI